MQLAPGTLVGAYRILHLIGSGGMGEVYAAEDLRLKRQVALKTLPTDIAADPSRVQRFKREAQALAAINHPNIVTIYSVEEVDGLHFFTMELIEGRTLSELLPPGGFSTAEALRLSAAIADGVAAAHKRGVIHRDLKPANVIVTATGAVKVLDFGLAKRHRFDAASDENTATATSEQTAEAGFVGTVAYMSPEQAEGRTIDQRSDIFSLGVMLYELTTGERPFTGQTPLSVLSAILRDTPRPITEVKSVIPADLERIVRRCLQKDASRRYQSAADLASDLLNLHDDVRPTGAATPSLPPVRRTASALRYRLLAICVVVSGIAVGVWKYSARSETPTPLVIDRVSRLTDHGAVSLAALSPDNQYLAYVKAEKQLQSLWIRQIATRRDLQIIPPEAVRFRSITYSRDGNHVLYVSNPTSGAGSTWGTLYRVPSLGGEPHRVLHDIDSGIAIAPEGDRFAFVRFVLSHNNSESQLIVVRQDGTDERVVLSLSKEKSLLPTRPAWSPSGQAILSLVQANDTEGSYVMVSSVNLSTGEVSTVPGRWSELATAVDWMPGGESFLLSATPTPGEPVQIWEVRARDGARTRVTADVNDYGSLSVSPDGASVVAMQQEAVSNIHIYRQGAAPQAITQGRVADGIAGMAWTPTGIVFSSTRGGTAEVWVVHRDGSSLRPFLPRVHPVGGPATTPDSRYLLFHRLDGTGWRVWRAAIDASAPRALTRGPLDVFAVPSNDGRWIYYNSAISGGVPVIFKIPLDGGEPVRVGQEAFTVSDVLPDGRLLGLCSQLDAAGQLTVFIAAITPEDGVIQQRFDDVPVTYGPIVPLSLGPTKTPDGKGLTFVEVRDDSANIWIRPLAGGRSAQVTQFRGTQIFSFAWSPDGELAVAHGQILQDIVMLTLTRR